MQLSLGQANQAVGAGFRQKWRSAREDEPSKEEISEVLGLREGGWPIGPIRRIRPISLIGLIGQSNDNSLCSGLTVHKGC